jgi:hypothetical protein
VVGSVKGGEKSVKVTTIDTFEVTTIDTFEVTTIDTCEVLPNGEGV